MAKRPAEEDATGRNVRDAVDIIDDQWADTSITDAKRSVPNWNFADVKAIKEASRDELVAMGKFKLGCIVKGLFGARHEGSNFDEVGVRLISLNMYCIVLRNCEFTIS